jgi:hypothetical protein
MAKPNYRQQKRQKELARKSRQEEKLLKRSPRPAPAADEAGNPTPPDPPAQST